MVQTRLKNRHLARFDRGDLARIFVDAHHVMSKIREAGSRHQAHIPCADHRDFHKICIAPAKMVGMSGS